MRFSSALAFLLLAANSALAGPITGQVWMNQPGASSNATIANQPGGASDATFTTTDFDYHSSVGGYTIGGFLKNPTFANTSAGFDPTKSLNNTYFLFTGSLFLNAGANSLSIGHDDGFQLQIQGFGTVVSEPGPTSFSLTPFTVTNNGPAGFFNFTLSYGETAGAPADLEFKLNDAPVGGVPEPSTFALFGMIAGCAGIGRWFHKRREIQL
jgi:hypothetical protein